jgi:hypothetical protein
VKSASRRTHHAPHAPSRQPLTVATPARRRRTGSSPAAPRAQGPDARRCACAPPAPASACCGLPDRCGSRSGHGSWPPTPHHSPRARPSPCLPQPSDANVDACVVPARPPMKTSIPRADVVVAQPAQRPKKPCARTRPWTHSTRAAAPQWYMSSGGQFGDTTPSKREQTWGKDRGVSPAQKLPICRDKAPHDRAITVCLPCRRSWVRVPSAAWKALQIGTFLVSRVVSVLRRGSRVRSPSANLGNAPARRAVPAASSGRLARADQVSPEPGDHWGQNPRPLTTDAAIAGPVGTLPHGSALSA